MPKPATIPRETFRFFRALSRNNHKPWMDANRERYQAEVVQPLRALFERLAPGALSLNSRFILSGHTGDNFSRINRDIRFAKDKTPYYPHMYLYFAERNGVTGQFYVGVSADALTLGFRIYGREKTAPLVQFGRTRGPNHGQWIEKQRRKLGRRYESYWYSTEKGEWTKHPGWPVARENWKKMQGWIIRRKLTPAAAARPGLEREILKAFRDTHPLHLFAASPNWKP